MFSGRVRRRSRFTRRAAGSGVCDYGCELFVEGLGYVCVAGQGGGVEGDGLVGRCLEALAGECLEEREVL